MAVFIIFGSWMIPAGLFFDAGARELVSDCAISNPKRGTDEHIKITLLYNNMIHYIIQSMNIDIY